MLGHLTATARAFDLEQSAPEYVDLFAVLVTLAAGPDDPDAWERVNRELAVNVLRRADTGHVTLAWWERDAQWRRSGRRSTQNGGSIPDWADDLLRRGNGALAIRAEGVANGYRFPMLPSERFGFDA